MSGAWRFPVPMGSHLAWFDGHCDLVIPVASIRPSYTDHRGDDLMNGYHAILPTENGAIVELTCDPATLELETRALERVGLTGARWSDVSPTSLWLYVAASRGVRVGAHVVDGRITYDPRCGGEGCIDCYHDIDQWWKYIHSPEQVLFDMSWLGSLPVSGPAR